MKKLIFILFIISSIMMSGCTGTKHKTKKATDKNGYVYEYVTNDPMQARIYTLKNGLKVYLTVNKDAPRLQTYIAVKAGSTYDPPQTTGLAHYLEHMMFKGGNKIGTANWPVEKELIKKISDLFELHKNTKDPKQKKLIYSQIDSVSSIAAHYAVANEYDKMVASMGAKGTNAFTSEEQTVYINDIPSNELDKWLKLERDRFGSLVLRLFHTELEAVYEEYNMGQDNDENKAEEALMSGLFMKHPYGTQTTIGKPEHLKNPSMVNIMNYWNNYYRPNNIAICISGDLDFDETIKLIDKYFGDLKPNDNIPKFIPPVEDPITKPVIKNVYGPDAEFMILAYRYNGFKSEDRKYVNLIDMILSNNHAGLMDLDLVQKQKVLEAGCESEFLKDYGMDEFYAKPRKGQSLENLRDLILSEIEKVKKGEFENWLITAVINDIKLREIRSLENNWRGFKFVEAFTKNSDWADNVKYIDELEKIKKEDIVRFANEHYKDNYVIVYKRTGKDTSVVKVEKPKITPVNLNRDAQSDYFKQFSKLKSPRLKPEFVDFQKEISTSKLSNGLEFNYIKNKTSELFTLYYIIDMGKSNNIKLPLAVDYLPYLGTDKYTPNQLQQELYKLGLSLGVYSSDERSYIYISGLEKSFNQGVELLEHILAHVKPDKKAYDDYVDGILKERANNKLDKYNIMWGALFNYGKYGKKSSFTNIISADELKKINPEELTNLIKQFCTYKHRIFLYSQLSPEETKPILDKFHIVPKQLKDYPAPIKYPEQNTDQNKVYFVNYDMVQSWIFMLAKDQLFNKELLPDARIFGEYFGSGLSSIVFQEIRESKALAYSAFASFSVPQKFNQSYWCYAYVASQADKLKAATEAMLNLMNNMPRAQKQFDGSKEAILEKIESERITKSNIFWTLQANLDLGINYDYRKDIYDKVQKTNLDEFEKFFSSHIKGKKYTYLIIGNKKDLNMKALDKLGKVEELTLEDIFNY